MDNGIKGRLEKLIDLKSIVTLLLTIVYCVMTLMRWVPVDNFNTIFLMVLTFYFGVQTGKKAGDQK